MSRSVSATNVGGALMTIALVVAVFFAGTRAGADSAPPPLVCVEQSRTGHPQVPGVFAVTLVCRVDVEQEVTFEPEYGERS